MLLKSGFCLKVWVVLVASMVLFLGQPLSAVAQEEMILVAPQKVGGMPLMEALNARQSGRDFGDKALSPQNLSNLLWAAFGANRADGKRTVPTARNKQNVDIYVVMKTGVWKYDGLKHILTLVKAGDVTSKYKAPLTLIYAAAEEQADVSGMHVGSIYQNVGLYCASAKLSNRVKTSQRNVLDGYIELPKGYKVFVVQVVGQ